MAFKFTRFCRANRRSDVPSGRPRWFGKPNTDIIRYGEIKAQLDHLNQGKWGGNIARGQPLWQSLEEAEYDDSIVAYTAGHPRGKSDEAKAKQQMLRLLEKEYPRPDPMVQCEKTWVDCGIDHVLSEILRISIGPNPTYAQAKVLPYLLQHSTCDVPPGDVLGSMPAKSGKTTLFLIGLMHAMRTEDAGLNMLLCPDAQSCYDCYNKIFGMLEHFGKACGSNPLEILGPSDRSWIMVAPFRDDAETYEAEMQNSLKHPRGPLRVLITCADVWNDMEMKVSKGRLNVAKFGYLRRLYTDDIQEQLALPQDSDPSSATRAYDRDPPAINLLLANTHQRLHPPTRALLQMALLSRDVSTQTKNYLEQLCLNIYNTKKLLSMREFPRSVLMKTFLYYKELQLPDFIFDILKSSAAETNAIRCVIITRDEAPFVDDLRKKLQRSKIKLHFFDDIHSSLSDGEASLDWRFLLLKSDEHEILRYIPDFTHLMLIDSYKDRFELAHILKALDQSGMSKQRLNLVHIWPSAGIRAFSETLAEMHVRLEDQPVYIERKKPSIRVGENRFFSLLSRNEVHRRVKPLERWDLDPQKGVEERYINLDDPVVPLNSELRRQSPATMLAKEDYTPLNVQKHRYDKAKKMHQETVKDQQVVTAMLERGMLNSTSFKPTRKMWDWLHEK